MSIAQEIDTTAAEAILGMKPTTLRWMADRLPLTRHGRQGRSRRWTPTDIIMISIANRLITAGFIHLTAIQMAEAAKPKLAELIATNGKLWMLAQHAIDGSGMGEFAFSTSSEEVLDILFPQDGSEASQVTILAVHDVVKSTLQAMIDHFKKAGGNA